MAYTDNADGTNKGRTVDRGVAVYTEDRALLLPGHAPSSTTAPSAYLPGHTRLRLREPGHLRQFVVVVLTTIPLSAVENRD
jgi:hypothetical protein